MSKTFTTVLEYFLVAVFLFLIVFLLMVEKSTTLVWTIVIPLLPLLFLIIGYSNWRNICPLAYFSKISQKLSWIPKRKVPIWFENNFYLFQYFLLFTAFSFRLTLLNFDHIYLGLFFVFVIVSSFLINLVFTGKSWCNFFCPVGVVEKIYCGSNAHKYKIDSACSTCSACKKNCPDIDMESNYWKENTNTQKTFVFYSFAGLILGFYTYFYLQSGSFESYYLGDWAHEYISLSSAGFFFAPFIPLFVAVPITLAIFTILSYYFFKSIENYIWKKNIFPDLTHPTLVHRIKIIASFVAFNIFYIFAGAPSYMHYPTLYAMFYFLVVVMATLTLHKEFFREESFFIQERFALNMIKMWTSTKPVPKNLKEIYYTYVNATKNKKEKLQTYKTTIHDLLNEGVLTEESMITLEKLREQMAISERDHLNVLQSIKVNNKELFDANIEQSSETRYQKTTYAKMLSDALTEHTHLSGTFIQNLQEQFCITDTLHQEIMSGLLNTNEKLHTDVMYLLKQMNALRRVHKSILNDDSHEIVYLKYVLRNEFSSISKELFNLLGVIYKNNGEGIKVLKKMFKYKNIGTKIDLQKSMLDFMDKKMASAIYELKKDFDTIKHVETVTANETIIKYLIGMESNSIIAAALLASKNYSRDFFTGIDVDKILHSNDSDLVNLMQNSVDESTEITTYEKMMYLHNIPMFNAVKYYGLKIFARSSQVMQFTKGEYIIKQGEAGDALFIIVKGSVEAQTDGIVVNRLRDKDYFGAVALLGDITRTASVQATEDVTLLTLSKDAFKKFMYDNPTISVKLMKSMIRRLLENKSCDLIHRAQS